MIFKVQTVPKSTWNATSNGDGARNRWQMLPAPSWGALFSLRVVFLSILGSHLGPRSATLERLSADFRDFLANFGPPCVFPSIEGARGQCWDRFWVSRGTSREGFLENFGWILSSLRSFVASKFCSKFVPSLSKFQISRCLAVGSGLGWPALSCRGGGRAERVKFKQKVVGSR